MFLFVCSKFPFMDDSAKTSVCWFCSLHAPWAPSCWPVRPDNSGAACFTGGFHSMALEIVLPNIKAVPCMPLFLWGREKSKLFGPCCRSFYPLCTCWSANTRFKAYTVLYLISHTEITFILFYYCVITQHGYTKKRINKVQNSLYLKKKKACI